jgi:Na+/melibiose symporter-like transporter
MNAPGLPLSTKLLYGLGDAPLTVTMVLFGLFVLFFYNSVMGLPASLVGAGVFLGLVFDALIDPYIGYLSDISRHPFGRRHVFMLWGAVFLGPCFFLLFSPPRGLSSTGVFLWLTIAWLAVRLSGAIYRIPYMSMGAELSQGYDDRTALFAIRGLFGLFATAVAAGLSFLVFFPAGAARSDPKLIYAAYPRMGVAFGSLITTTGLIAVFTTRRYRTFGVPNGKEAEGAPRQIEFMRTALQALRNRNFVSIWVSFVLFFLAVVFNASVAVNYFTWYAGIPNGRDLSAIQISFYIGALTGVFIWIACARRLEKLTIYVTATVSLAVVMFCGTVLIGPGHLLGTNNVPALALGHAVAGIFASAVWIVPPSMAADVVDQDELQTSLRREGVYFGILNLGDKVAAGGAVLFSGVLLNVFQRLSGAQAGAMAHAPAKPILIGILYGAIPSAILLVAAFAVLPYKLGRRAVGEIRTELQARARRVSLEMRGA